MVIENREELYYVISKDIEKYKKAGYKNKFISYFMHNDVGKIVSFMKALRHEEYWLTKAEYGGGGFACNIDNYAFIL